MIYYDIYSLIIMENLLKCSFYDECCLLTDGLSLNSSGLIRIHCFFTSCRGNSMTSNLLSSLNFTRNARRSGSGSLHFLYAFLNVWNFQLCNYSERLNYHTDYGYEAVDAWGLLEAAYAWSLLIDWY